ncbi:hypothetical protein [Streptomyces sp. NBRC 109706]|uniref:hypothetical protein n=1 Tax=Streptomyces sp. NBRC 109706 TaxID=1550035 RepID=UPI00078528AD|nr:hypothetical protein [Streptomyces sp. NBRC 109706]
MALFKRKATGQPGEWYYCLKHGKVEEGPECPAKDRLGPYPSRAEAAQAIEIARERDDRWRNDPRWAEDPDEPREPGEPDDRGRGPADTE